MRRCLSVSEVRQLLSAVELGSPFGHRDFLLIMFLYQTGLRVGECSRLLVQLVSRGGQSFSRLDLPAIFCKGPRGLVVPLNVTARACVEKQLTFNQKHGFSVAPAAPLFQNKKHCPLSIRKRSVTEGIYPEVVGQTSGGGRVGSGGHPTHSSSLKRFSSSSGGCSQTA